MPISYPKVSHSFTGVGIWSVFDQVVATLVQPVNVAFDLRDLLGSRTRATSQILFVPKSIVVLMLLTDQLTDSLIGIVDWLLMPLRNSFDLELRDLVYGGK